MHDVSLVPLPQSPVRGSVTRTKPGRTHASARKRTAGRDQRPSSRTTVVRYTLDWESHFYYSQRLLAGFLDKCNAAIGWRCVWTVRNGQYNKLYASVGTVGRIR